MEYGIPRRNDWVSLKELRPHEEILNERVNLLVSKIKSDLLLKLPSVLIDVNSFLIIDGHHRVKAFEQLGWSELYVTMVDYEDESIICHPNAEWPKKADVKHAAARGQLLPPKSTSHHIRATNGVQIHIENFSDFYHPSASCKILEAKMQEKILR